MAKDVFFVLNRAVGH